MIKLINQNGATIIGRLGENEATVIKFFVGDIIHEHPDCTFTLLNKRPNDPAAYPVPVANYSREGNHLYWTVTSGDLTQIGNGECELVASEDGIIVKTEIYSTRIERALDGSGTVPEPWESWVEQVTDAADRAEAAASLLENPGAEAETLAPGSSATASYEDGTFSFGIPEGEKGDTGATPDISIGTVQSGATAAATMTGTAEEPVLNLTLPKGDKGDTGNPGHSPVVTASKNGKVTTVTVDGSPIATIDDGTDGTNGQDGYSPTATVSKSGNKSTITITDKNGTTTAQVTDGTDGTNGITPNVTAGTTTTGAAGTDASVTRRAGSPDSAPIFDFTIPKGDKGDTGEVSEAELSAVAEAKADVIVDSVSGAIASFPDGADNRPVRSLVVGIEPVQDLHGQESPYPAGGGKNKWKPTTSKTVSGVTFTVDDDGNVTLNNTSTELILETVVLQTQLPAGTYTVSANNPASNANISLRIVTTQSTTAADCALTTQNASLTFTVVDPITAVTIRIGNGIALSNFKFSPQLESGSSATSFSPYSNICPISGWTGCNVTRTGGNLFDKNATDTNNGYVGNGYLKDDGTITTTSDWRISEYIPVTAEKNYILTGLSGNAPSICFYNSNKEFVSGTKYANNTTLSITTGSTVAYCRISVRSNYTDITKIAMGTTYPVSWQTEAGTVYCASLDVVSGELTVTHSIIDLGSLTWSVTGNRFYSITINDAKHYIASQKADIYCSSYKPTSRNNIVNGCVSLSHFDIYVYVNIVDEQYSDKNTFKTAVTGQKLVYPLATPVTYQLTNQQVIETLKGVNYVWADTGEVSVTYPCDTKLYIDKQIATLQALILENT